jgi:hypothetical protein
MSKKADEKRQTMRKQYTGKPGRPREVEIGGITRPEPVEIQRLSATSDPSTAKGVERLSGATPRVSGVEIISKGEPPKE